MLVVLFLLVLSATAAPLPEARLDPGAPPTERELEASRRLDERACPAAAGLIIGVGRLCARRPVEGLVLAGLATAHTASFAAWPRDNAGAAGINGLTLTAMTSLGADALDGYLHHRRPYTPPETLGELAAAPFRPEVLRRPGVWIPTAIASAAGITFGVLSLEEGQRWPTLGRRNLFGADAPPAIGVPVGLGLHAGTMLQVAMAEELVFRGVLQGAASRALGPAPGLIVASVVFWAFHVPNWTVGPREEWGRNLAIGSAFVGSMGLTMGAVHQGYGYRLSHPVAMHFWYNTLLTTFDFLADPENNRFSAQIVLPL